MHITAKILGHESLDTTQTYVAVYDQDVIDHHRAFLTRAAQPGPPRNTANQPTVNGTSSLATSLRARSNWAPVGVPTARVANMNMPASAARMLRPDPNQRTRLENIITSLRERLAEATERSWLGDVERLTVSLAAAQLKIVQMQRTATNLGLSSLQTERI